jgi:hypothetical protein
MSKKIKTAYINLNVNTGTMIYVDIDTFRFLYDEETVYLTVQIEENGSYEFLDEVELAEDEIIIDHNDLKRVALNWIFDNVKIVKEKDLDKEVAYGSIKRKVI